MNVSEQSEKPRFGHAAAWLDVQDMADRYGVSIKHIPQLVKAGTVPPPVRFSPRCRRWSAAALEAHEARLTATRNEPATAT